MAFTLIALFEIAKSTGVIEPADFFAEANDTTNTLDGQHQ